MELSRYDLTFETRRAIKSQALLDFLTKSTNTTTDSGSIPPSWNFYVDGSSTKDENRAGLTIESPPGEQYKHALKFMFKASNNEAEYKVLTTGVSCTIPRRLTWSEHFRTLSS